MALLTINCMKRIVYCLYTYVLELQKNFDKVGEQTLKKLKKEGEKN